MEGINYCKVITDLSHQGKLVLHSLSGSFALWLVTLPLTQLFFSSRNSDLSKLKTLSQMKTFQVILQTWKNVGKNLGMTRMFPLISFGGEMLKGGLHKTAFHFEI